MYCVCEVVLIIFSKFTLPQERQIVIRKILLIKCQLFLDIRLRCNKYVRKKYNLSRVILRYYWNCWRNIYIICTTLQGRYKRLEYATRQIIKTKSIRIKIQIYSIYIHRREYNLLDDCIFWSQHAFHTSLTYV